MASLIYLPQERRNITTILCRVADFGALHTSIPWALIKALTGRRGNVFSFQRYKTKATALCALHHLSRHKRDLQVDKTWGENGFALDAQVPSYSAERQQQAGVVRVSHTGGSAI